MRRDITMNASTDGLVVFMRMQSHGLRISEDLLFELALLRERNNSCQAARLIF
jgi:hypothetical protein